MKDMKTAIIYARVSSSGSLESRQSTQRQVIDLTDYADRNSMTICKTFEEHISGAKRNEERAVLTECIEYAISNRVDVVLFSELSRCGRAIWEVLDTIRTLKDNGINAYFQKEGLSLFSADGRENIYLAVMVSVLSSASQIERENLIFRLKSGRRVYVDKNLAATGKSGLGRKVGYRKPVETKKEEYKETLKLLKAGYPIRKVAKLTDVSESTVKRLKKEFGI
jgi:DNA invertase Pin-like site-specific DNA recombinase